MNKCQCVYFQTDSGRIPAKEFVDSLDNRSQQKYFEVIELLEQYGKSLPEPHAKHLRDGVYELRFFGIEGRIRILYFFYHKAKAVFTNGLIKKTGAIPGNVLKTAKERMDVYSKRLTKKEVI